MSKESLQAEIDRLDVQIAELQQAKAALREKLNSIVRSEAEARREKIKSILGLSKKEHAERGNYLVTHEVRDLCWAYNLPYVSNQIVGQLISAGRIEGHQYKGGYFATREAVMVFIEEESADPSSQFYELPDDADLASGASQ